MPEPIVTNPDRVYSDDGSSYIEDSIIVKPLYNGLKMTWTKHIAEEEIIVIEVTRLHQHKEGKLEGEIAVSHGKYKTSLRLLHRALFNFNSTTTRASLSKALNVRCDTVDWVEVLEQACGHVLEHVRTGEPSQLLSTETDFTPPEYLLYPILLKDEPNVIFGDGESGKSLTALMLALMVQLPYTHNKLGLTPTRDVTKVLYLDWETTGNTTGWRYKQLTRGFELPPMEIEYRHCEHPLYDDLEAVARLVRGKNISCVFIDSIGAAAGGDINSTVVANEFYAALRKLKVTSVCLGHTSKNKENASEKTLYGNAFFTNYARMVWRSVRTSTEGGDTISVALHHRKANYTKHHAPIGFKFTFTPTDIKVESIEVETDTIDVSEFGLNQRIYEVLKRGSMTAGEIARAVEAPRRTVDTTLGRMKKEKAVVNHEGFRWGLPVREMNYKPGGD